MKSKLFFFLFPCFFDNMVEFTWSPILCQLSAQIIFTRKSAHILWRRLSPSLDKTLGRKKWLLSSRRPPKWWYLTFECFEGCLSVPRIDGLLKKFIKSGAKIVSSKLETTRLTTLHGYRYHRKNFISVAEYGSYLNFWSRQIMFSIKDYHILFSRSTSMTGKISHGLQSPEIQRKRLEQKRRCHTQEQEASKRDGLISKMDGEQSYLKTKEMNAKRQRE